MSRSERTTNNEQRTTNSLLWEITKKGIEHPSYLYGTIHIQDKRVFSFDRIVTDKLYSCDVYAMESIIDDIDPVSLQKVFFMKKHSLKELLKPKEYNALSIVLHDKTTGTAHHVK